MKSLKLLALLSLLFITACSGPAEEKASKTEENKTDQSSSSSTSSKPADSQAASSGSAPAQGSAAADPNQPTLLITLETIEKNAEFQRNVQFMEGLRNQVMGLKATMDREADETKKAELKEQLEAALAKLNESNQTMMKAYGYSISNRHLSVVDTGVLFIQLTADDVEKSRAENPDFEGKEGAFTPLLKIEGAEENETFQRNVQAIEQLRNNIIQAQQAVEAETDEAKKKALQEQIAKATEQAQEFNKQMFERYQYTLNRKYQYLPEVARIYRLPAAAGIPKEAPNAIGDNLVRVASIGTIEENRNFQRNVQVMQAMLGNAVRLRAAIDEESDAGKKAELEKQLAEATAALEENNTKMVEAYQYSLNRNYNVVVEKARVYLILTEEEQAQLKQEKPELSDSELQFQEVVSLNSIEAYQRFQNDVQTMLNFRNQIVEAQKQLEAEGDEEKKSKLKLNIEQAIQQLSEANKKMIQDYNYSINRNYNVAIEQSHIYVELTPEEIEARKQQGEAAGQ